MPEAAPGDSSRRSLEQSQHRQRFIAVREMPTPILLVVRNSLSLLPISRIPLLAV